MRLKVPFFCYVLAIAGLLLPSAVLVAALPSLINTGPVKARLLAELREWTGGDVKVAGPVSMASLLSLTVELRNVELGSADTASVKAARLAARVSWGGLLSGHLVFDKIKIFDAVIHAKGGNTESIGGTLLSALARAHQNPFAALTLTNSVIIFESAAQQPGRKLEIDNASFSVGQSDGSVRASGHVRWKGEPIGFRLTTSLPAAGRPAVPVPTILNVDSRLMSGGFNGETSLNGALNAAGYLSLTTPDLPGFAKWAGWPLEDGMPNVVQLTGSLNLAPDWVSLQSAAFAVAGQKATGDLTLKFTDQPVQLEGALAFDDLDLGPLWRETLGEPLPASGAPRLSRALTSLDMDLRISAELLRWEQATAKPAAFSLTSKAGVFSADIAELGLFDGSVLGHVEADLAHEPARAIARLTAENIDTALILGTVSEQPWLAGRAEARLELEAAGHGGKQLLESAKAHARVSFTDGGSIPFDIPRLAKASPAQGVNGWSELGLTATAVRRIAASAYFAGQRIAVRGSHSAQRGRDHARIGERRSGAAAGGLALYRAQDHGRHRARRGRDGRCGRAARGEPVDSGAMGAPDHPRRRTVRRIVG